jgi:hypothetical protein
MPKKIAAIAALVVLIAAPALAQQAPPQRIRGTIEKVAGDQLTIKASDGMDMSVTLSPKTRINTLVRRTLADIKPGDFLASTGIRGTDGKIHAIEVRILPQPTPDGGRQFPWDLNKNSVMTNATVGTVTKAPKGAVVHVKFKGGESEYSIGSEAPILASVPGNRGELKPGAAVFVVAPKAPDGGLNAAFMYVETNGIKPPM